MAFPARVFRILIASPADVAEERDIAVRIIQEWNDLNSAERELVLLPVRWETHSAPEYGRRPQEVINRQVVDQCDFLVGIFWTRVGSPTGVADSGTLEEIERVATQGKPVMLYFSQAKQDPEKIELEQLQKLREFKKKTFPKALVESYSTQIEFRDKLAKQIEIRLRTLIAEQSEDLSTALNAKPVTDIQLGFADPKTGSCLGSEMTIETENLEIEGVENLPDYEETRGDQGGKSSEAGFFVLGVETINKDFYRETVAYYARRNFFWPIRLWLKNTGGVGARDVYVDLRVSSEETKILLSSLPKARLSTPTKSKGWLQGTASLTMGESSATEPEQHLNQWGTYLELRALQPQREISPPTQWVIGAKKSGLILVNARIYADTLSEPTIRTLRINCKVRQTTVGADELLNKLLPPEDR